MSQLHQRFEEPNLTLDAATSRDKFKAVSDDGIVELLLPATSANAIVR